MSDMFEIKEIDENSTVKLYLPCKEVKAFCRSVERQTGKRVFLVGGAIRQLVRTICWKGETPENVYGFLEANLRDRDVLVEGEISNVDKAIVESLWRHYLPKWWTELDLIIVEGYFEKLDWHSNAVKYNGEHLYYLPLKEGEDYICKPKIQNSPEKLSYLLLRGWINHHPMRGFSCFKETRPEVEAFIDNFYFPVYLKKMSEMALLYGQPELFLQEMEWLLENKLIDQSQFEYYTSNKQSSKNWVRMNSDTLIFVLFQIVTFAIIYFFLF